LKVLEITTLDVTIRAFLKPLIRALEKEGFVVYEGSKDTGFVEELKKDGFKVREFPIRRGYNIFYHIFSIIILVNFIRKEKFIVVHTHTPIAGFVGRIAAYISRTPIIIHTSHGIPFDERKKFMRAVYFRIEKFLSYITAKIFVINGDEYEILTRRKIIDPRKLMRINSVGVDTEMLSSEKVSETKEEIRKSLGIPEDSVVVTTIARLTREKGLAELTLAFNRVIREIPNVFFLIVGSAVGGDREPFAEMDAGALIEDKKEQFFFLGFRSDVPRVLKASDIFVLASYREGMPKSILEAMAMGLPVIATNISGNREEVIDRETGILVPVQDAESLSQSIISLADDKNKIALMGELGRKRALEVFDEKKILEKQILVIKELVEQCKNMHFLK